MINFDLLEDELLKAVAADEKYERENSAKFRAVEQKVATYDEFRDIVNASHLKPLEKKEKLVDPDIVQKKRIWNTVAGDKSEKNVGICQSNEKKKHFTERQ